MFVAAAAAYVEHQIVHEQEAEEPKALLERGAAWGPWRTLASLYLWRIADGQGEVETTPRPQAKAATLKFAKKVAASTSAKARK